MQIDIYLIQINIYIIQTNNYFKASKYLLRIFILFPTINLYKHLFVSILINFLPTLQLTNPQLCKQVKIHQLKHSPHAKMK